MGYGFHHARRADFVLGDGCGVGACDQLSSWEITQPFDSGIVALTSLGDLRGALVSRVLRTELHDLTIGVEHRRLRVRC